MFRTTLLLFFAVAVTVSARIIEVTPGGAIFRLQQATTGAMPGDTILFRAGVYPGGDYVTNLQGRPDAWITIMAAPGETVTIGGAGNGWQFADAAYLRVSGFTVGGQSGNAFNFDDAGTFDTPAHHIAVDRCRFTALTANNQNNQLKLSGVDTFEVSNCTFEDGPEGCCVDMVGCHVGRFSDNLFVRFADVGIQSKGATSRIIIERNRFEQGGARALNVGGSTGLPYFRPQGANYEAKEIGVYDNVFVGGDAPIAFTGAVGCEVVNNTIWLPKRWAFRILQETTLETFVQCGDNAFRNNIVVVDNTALTPIVNVGPNTRPETFGLSNNLWYRVGDLAWKPWLPATEIDGVLGLDPLLAGAPADMTPAPGSPAIGAGATVAYPLADHRGRPFRTPRSIGAVEGATASSIAEARAHVSGLHVGARSVTLDGAGELELVDPLGRIVARGTTRIDLATIARGRYFVVATSDAARTFVPVIVP
jgi:hypothetical protein